VGWWCHPKAICVSPLPNPKDSNPGKGLVTTVIILGPKNRKWEK